MATTNLEIPAVSTSQNNKPATINQADSLLDESINSLVTIDIDNANYTLTDTQPSDAEAKQNIVVEVTTTTTPLTASRTVYVPADKKWWFFQQNADVDEQYSVTVRVTGDVGAGVVLQNDGGITTVYCDGTDCIVMARRPNETRTALEATTGTVDVDMEGPIVRNATLTGATTIALNNPRVGNSIVLDITGGGFGLTLPGSVTVVGGGTFATGSRNFITILCVDSSTPVYIASIVQ